MIATLKILLAIGDGALPRFEALACSLFSEWDWSFWARLLLAVYDCFVAEVCMLGIPRRFSHFVYGFIQSGLTCAIAAAIASFPFLAGGAFVTHWLQSWLFSWITMSPIVLFAAPAIRNLTHILTRED